MEPAARSPFSQYLWAFGAVVSSTIVNAWARAYFDLADQAMLYILAVLVVASRLSRGPSLFAAVASVAAFDFFFVPPFYTFAVHETRHIVTFAVMLVVGLIVSGLTLRIREHAADARERERRTAALYAMSRELAVRRRSEDLARVALRHVRDLLGIDATVLVKEGDTELEALATSDARGPLPAESLDLALRAMALGHTTGAESERAPSADFLAAPMIATRGPIGAFVLRLSSQRPLPSVAHVQALEAFVAQTALAIERSILSGEAEKAHVAVETERTRNTLLAAVSHDLRTPLASIGGSAGILLDPFASLDAEHRRELLETIRDESSRLARLVTGLLDLVRLESGAIKVRKEWCPIEELFSSAIGRLEGALEGREVRTRIDDDEIVLAAVDPVLFEQVLINLLENASKYSPPGSPIELRTSVAEGKLRIDVADEGPGLAPGDAARVFEKFYRAADGRRSPGVGLGLAVCDAIVKAHGGRIAAESVPGGGAVFSISLPLPPRPPNEAAWPRERSLTGEASFPEVGERRGRLADHGRAP